MRFDPLLLPDHILLHMLFFLPRKDAARTSVFSETWLKVQNLLAVVTFDFDRNLYSSKQDDVRDAFLSIIDGLLINLLFKKQ